MEHFFVDEDFFDSIEDFMHDRQLENKEEIEELKDDWEQKIEYTQLEKIITANDNLIDEIAEHLYDANVERFPESDKTFDKLKEALKKSIDTEKLNKMMPELWYPKFPHEYGKITKQDLLDAL